MIKEFDVSLEELHNDSTSLTVTGQYVEADGRRMRGKPTLIVTFGHNNYVASAIMWLTPHRCLFFQGEALILTT
jgi:hypothetical protein